jgi:glycosyltransferase involved in cell wall biosynthesis
MNVLHVSHFDRFGGAAQSARRLHDGLRAIGVTSRMLVGEKESDDPDVRRIVRGRADRLALRVSERVGIQYPFLPSSLALTRDPWLRSADVLQLHNIHGGFFSHTSLPLLGRGRRLVWCLHDMWAFTGHCGYSFDSDRWLTGCGNCPHLDSYPAVRHDMTRLNWRLKQLVYSGCRLTITAPSHWLADLARRSPLLGHFDVHVIPYGLDTEIFHPRLREDARSELGLESRRAVLVVGLEERKGARLLPAILSRTLAEGASNIVLLVAGREQPADVPPGVEVRALGQIAEEGALARAFAASDAFLLPTAIDNLPNTLLEALAVGTPIVASRVGGVPEAVEDGVTGFLAPLDADALGVALARVLSDDELSLRMRGAARHVAEERYTLERQASAYRALYDAV